MVIKEPAIFAAIEIIGSHFRANISNRYTQRIFDSMSFDPAELKQANALLEKSENYRYQDYHLDELYVQILAAGHFVSCTRSQVLPTLRIESIVNSSGRNDQDRVLQEIAASTFGLNLNILADMLGDLYTKAVEIEKEATGKRSPVYASLPDLTKLGSYLSTCS